MLEDETDGIWKGGIRIAHFLPVGEACKAIFWRIPGLKKRQPLKVLDSQQKEVLTSASAVSHHRDLQRCQHWGTHTSLGTTLISWFQTNPSRQQPTAAFQTLMSASARLSILKLQRGHTMSPQ